MINRIAYILLVALLRLTAQQDVVVAPDMHRDPSFPLPVLIPLSTYVVSEPVEGGTEENPTPISASQALQLQVSFRRQNLPMDCGVQFLTITTSVFNKKGILKDKIVKQAFTFPISDSGITDMELLHTFAQRIVPFGFVSEKKIERVMVEYDTVPEWSLIRVDVAPSEEYTKFAERSKYTMTWWYRVTGSQLEYEFFLGIPKVLYDSRKNDPIIYGNASAMLRFYYLHKETGHRFPFNVGIGTFGVSTPIDVSRDGGGFAVSLLFDIVQATRLMYDLNITNNVNAGIELTPFFPIQRTARLLINARIGYSP